MTELEVTDAMADEAITWFARLRADDVSDLDRNGFVSWLRSERAHQITFLEIMDLWDDMAIVSSLDFEEVRDFSSIWKRKEAVRSGLSGRAGSESMLTLRQSPA